MTNAKKADIVLSGLLVLCFLFLAEFGCAIFEGSSTAETVYIVTFDWTDTLTDAQDTITALGIMSDKRLDIINGITAKLTKEQAKELASLPGIRYVEEDFPVYALDAAPEMPSLVMNGNFLAVETPDESVPNWNMTMIKAAEAQTSNQASGIRVGVIDTGIASNHPDLVGSVMGGFNAIEPGQSWEDDNNHGTYCASVIAARKNGVGIIGVAPKALLYSIKVLSNTGSGTASSVVAGYQWALEQGIQVVNLSLGSYSESLAMREAMEIAREQGMGSICAAGNDGREPVIYPARNPMTVCVGAVGTAGQRTAWSNYGNKMTTRGLQAPGYYILCANKDNGWQRASGTSLATPHVTGLVALMLGMRNARFDLMSSTASRANSPDKYNGYGVIDCRAGLDALIGYNGGV